MARSPQGSDHASLSTVGDAERRHHGVGIRLSVPLEEFLQTGTEQPALVEGFLAKAGLNVFGGEAKAFKTQCALQLGLSVATGRPFLGRQPVHSGGVLYVTEEGNQQGLAQRLSQLASSFPTPSGAFHVLHKAGVTFTGPGWNSVLSSLDELQDPTLVILDTFAALMDGDENSTEDTRNALRPVQRLTERGATVLLLHHVGKRQDAGRPGAMLRGNTYLRGASDAITIFKRGTSHGQGSSALSLTFEAKDWDTDPMKLTWDKSTGLLLPLAKVAPCTQNEPPSATPAAPRNLADAALEAGGGEAVSFATLQAAFPQRSRSALHRDIGRAVDHGWLETVGRGRDTIYLPKVELGAA